MRDADAFSIRTAGQEDLGAVARVHASHRPDGPLHAPLSELVQETWERMVSSAELTVYIAEVGDDAVGTATMTLLPNITYDCLPTAIIEAVVVAPDHRRKGIASAIMAAALADARTAGCNKVQLLSHKRHADDGGHRLYQSLGFEPEAEGFRLYLRGPPPGHAAR